MPVDRGLDLEETTRSGSIWPGLRDEHGRVRWSPPEGEAAPTLSGFLDQDGRDREGVAGREAEGEPPRTEETETEDDAELDELEVEPVEETYPSAFEVVQHPLVGVVLSSRFEIRSLIGKGAHSFVFRAFDRHLGMPVALKVLRPELGDRIEEFRERFHREAAIAQDVSHPRIAAVHDSGEIDATSCFIAMELLVGRNLKHVLRDDGPVPVARALPIFHQVADALWAAHEAGFIHRDIKPSNIFLLETRPGVAAKQGAVEEIKLLDFGLVKGLPKSLETTELEEVGDEVELTDAGIFVGTPSYAAPEQLRSTHAGPRTDVYALGVLMYRVLTGALPFVGSSMVDLAAKHLDAPVPSMKALNKDVDIPPALEAIVQRCMEKEPDHRYADMPELMTALEKLARDLSIAMPARMAMPRIREEDLVEMPPLPPPATGLMDVAVLAGSLVVLCAVAIIAVVLLF